MVTRNTGRPFGKNTRSSWWIGMCLVFAWLGFSSAALAQELEYSAIDQATVRVLALGDVELLDLERQGHKVKLAAPITGHGSGFLVTADGLIATAAHVVEDARAVAVHLPGVSGPLPAEVLEVDSQRDVAFLRVVGSLPKPARLAPPDDKLKIRQSVFAVGYPLDATRSDPQSTRGVVSGKLPDGRLQLGISVNPGNSGGPIIDEAETVHGIVVARSNVKEGEIGLAAAVPIAAFHDKYQSWARTPLTPAQRKRLDSDKAHKLADLVSVMAHEGFDILRGSIDREADKKGERKKQVVALYHKMPDSPDATLLAAVFFWNRAVARRLEGRPAAASFRNAKKLAEEAIRLEPGLKENAFLRHVIGAPQPAADSNHAVPDTLREKVDVHFVAQARRPVEFYALRGKSSDVEIIGLQPMVVTRETYQHICEAPCTRALPIGSYRFGLGSGGGDPVSAGVVEVDAPLTIEGTYEDRSDLRTLGAVIGITGTVVGSILLYVSLTEECDMSGADCGPESTKTAVGLGLVLGGLLTWALTNRISDGAKLQVLPGMEAGERTGTRVAEKERRFLEWEVPVATATHGARLQWSF